MSDWPPGSYNWTQRTDLDDGLADRMNRSIGFSVPVDDFDAAYEILDGRRDVPQDELDGLVEGDRRKAFDEATGTAGVHTRIRPAEVGRGAGGVGVVIEYLFTVAESAVIAVETARLVRAAYRRIAEVEGVRPAVTLGAAEQLAADDLAGRLGVPEGETFELVGSGDLRSHSQDRAFTGADAFWVVLGDGTQLHHHHVTAYGEVFYAGTSPIIPGWGPDSEPPRYEGPG